MASTCVHSDSPSLIGRHRNTQRTLCWKRAERQKRRKKLDDCGKLRNRFSWQARSRMQGEIAELLKHFIMGFSALLPLVNPFGSALSVIAIVGLESEETYKSLARKIAISTVLFFMAIGLVG